MIYQGPLLPLLAILIVVQSLLVNAQSSTCGVSRRTSTTTINSIASVVTVTPCPSSSSLLSALSSSETCPVSYITLYSFVTLPGSLSTATFTESGSAVTSVLTLPGHDSVVTLTEPASTTTFTQPPSTVFSTLTLPGSAAPSPVIASNTSAVELPLVNIAPGTQYTASGEITVASSSGSTKQKRQATSCTLSIINDGATIAVIDLSKAASNGLLAYTTNQFSPPPNSTLKYVEACPHGVTAPVVTIDNVLLTPLPPTVSGASVAPAGAVTTVHQTSRETTTQTSFVNATTTLQQTVFQLQISTLTIFPPQPSTQTITQGISTTIVVQQYVLLLFKIFFDFNQKNMVLSNRIPWLQLLHTLCVIKFKFMLIVQLNSETKLYLLRHKYRLCPTPVFRQSP